MSVCGDCDSLKLFSSVTAALWFVTMDVWVIRILLHLNGGWGCPYDIVFTVMRLVCRMVIVMVCNCLVGWLYCRLCIECITDGCLSNYNMTIGVLLSHRSNWPPSFTSWTFKDLGTEIVLVDNEEDYHNIVIALHFMQCCFTKWIYLYNVLKYIELVIEPEPCFVKGTIAPGKVWIWSYDPPPPTYHAPNRISCLMGMPAQ